MALSSMRKGIFSAIFLGLLVMGAAGLVVMDWTGSYSHGTGSGEVAKVEGVHIQPREFDMDVQRILRTQQMEPQTAYEMGLINQVLASKIMNILMNKTSHDLGIAVSDEEVAKRVAALVAPLAGPNGDKKETLQRLLQAQNMSEAELVETLRNELANTMLRQSLTAGVYVPNMVANALARYQGEKRSVEYVRFPHVDVKLENSPSDKELKEFYETVKLDFTVPEKRNVTLAVFDPNKFNTSVTVSDEEIEQFYNENTDSFAQPAKRTLEQALVSDAAQAQKIIDAVKGGKDVKSAVEQVTGNAKAFNGRNDFDEKSLPDMLATPVFAAKINDVVGPVQSPLGFHVVKIVGEVDAKTKPLDEVKESIRKEILATKTSDTMFETISLIEDRLAGGESFEKLKAEYKLDLLALSSLEKGAVKVDQLSQKFSKDEEKIIQSIWALQVGETSSMSDLSDGRMYVVKVDQSTPLHQKALDDVKKDVIALWEDTQKAQKNIAATESLFNEVKAGKKEFSKLGRAAQSAVIARSDKAAQNLPAPLVGSFMMAKKGDVVSISTPDAVFIGRVKEITLPSLDNAKADQQKKNLEETLPRETLELLLAHMEKTGNVRVNQAQLERMYGTKPDGQ